MELRSLSNYRLTHSAAQTLPGQHKAIQWQLLYKSAFILLSSIYLSLVLETGLFYMQLIGAYIVK